GCPPLGRGRARFVGEAVAAVAARNRYVAEDAADLVAVEYTPLPVVSSADDALRPGAPRLHDELAENVYFRRTHVRGDVGEAFGNAAVVVTGSFRHQRVAGVPMEGRGIAAAWDHAGGWLTVGASAPV